MQHGKLKCCINFLVWIRSYVGVVVHCYVRKSSIYPSPPHCLTIHYTCCPPFLAPVSVQFLMLMSVQKLTHIHNMPCCLYNLMSTHKSSATAVLLQWSSDTNRTTCAQTHNSDCAVSGANAVCYALVTVVSRPGSKLGACTVVSERVQMQWYYSHKEFGAAVRRRMILNCNNYLWK